MKKVLLSCVTCLLALGLVTGCVEEEEKATGGDDSTTQDSGDTTTSGDETTQGGGTTEAVTLSNYTLAFSFVDEEEEPTTLGEDVDLYISGDWNSWSFDICTLGEDGVYTLTIASIDAGTYEYKGVTVAAGETPASNWSNVEEVITGTSGATGNAELVVLASEGDNYTHKITVSITGGVVAEPFDPEDYTFIYKISIVYGEDKTPLEAAPAGVVLYAAGDFNGTKSSEGDWYDWGSPVRLYDNGDGTYYLGLDFVPEASRSFEILADDTTDSTQDMWGYIICEHTITYEEVSSTDDHPVVEITISTEYVGWAVEGGVFPPLGEDVEFYVLIYDNSTTTGLTGSDSATFTAQVACWSDGSSDSCTANEVQTTTGSKYVFYSEIATAPQNTNTWFSFAIGSSTMSIAASNVPSKESGTPVYVNYGWMDSSWLNGQSWNANDNGEGTWSYLAEGQTIEAFAQAITLS